MIRRFVNMLAIARDFARSRRRLIGALVAVSVFAVAIALQFEPVRSEGAFDHVPVFDPDWARIAPYNVADVKFEAWLVARHAQTLLTRPQHLFDTEHCAPYENTLTFGIPMLTMGLLGVPGYVAFGDIVPTYNSALVLWLLFAALAMYALVSEWTGRTAAGIVAGLLYAFHPSRLLDIAHPSVIDTTWIVLSLLFSQRLFSNGRWRDAVALSVSSSLLIGASFYPFAAAVFLSLPYIPWLVIHYRLRKVRLAQLVFVALSIALAAAFVFGPYVEAREASDTLHRTQFHYFRWSSYLTGRLLYPGVIVLILAAIGLAVPRKFAFSKVSGDPRWALVIGAVLVAVMAAGPDSNAVFQQLVGPTEFEIPNFHELLAQFVPGFDTIRGVSRFALGVHIVLSLLAGIGASALIGRFGRGSSIASVVLVLAVASLTLLWPGIVGFDGTTRWNTLEIRPKAEDIRFFADLARLGNEGPILELPFDDGGYLLFLAPDRISLSFYHERRTSACFGSYTPDRSELKRAAAALPAVEAKETLMRMGFTTVIDHQKPNLRAKGTGNRRTGRYGTVLLSGINLTAYDLGESRPDTSSSTPAARATITERFESTTSRTGSGKDIQPSEIAK